MKAEKMMNAIGKISDRHIEEFAVIRNNKRRTLWIKVLSAAACLCVVLSAIIILPGMIKSAPPTKIPPNIEDYSPTGTPVPSEPNASETYDPSEGISGGTCSDLCPTLGILDDHTDSLIFATSIEEVVSLLQNADLKNYPEEVRKVYDELFSALKKPGFIYSVDAANSKDGITCFVKDGKNVFFILPYTQHEDMGIASYVVFREAVYYVLIYTADEKVLAQTETVSEYFEARMNGVQEITEEGNTVFYTTKTEAGKQKNHAIAFIDSDHYYRVSAEVTKEELKAFLDVVSFQKIPLE